MSDEPARNEILFVNNDGAARLSLLFADEEFVIITITEGDKTASIALEVYPWLNEMARLEEALPNILRAVMRRGEAS